MGYIYGLFSKFMLKCYRKVTYMVKIKSAKDFGKEVRTYRKRHKITQDELARLANLSRKSIIQLEAGKSTIQFLVIEKIMKITNLVLYLEGNSDDT